MLKIEDLVVGNKLRVLLHHPQGSREEVGNIVEIMKLVKISSPGGPITRFLTTHNGQGDPRSEDYYLYFNSGSCLPYFEVVS